MKAMFIFLFLLLLIGAVALGILAVVSLGVLKLLDKADELLEAKRRNEAKRAIKRLQKVTRKTQ